MDIIQGFIETGNAGKSGWRIINNKGTLGVVNKRTSNVSYSILNSGTIAAGSNFINSYSTTPAPTITSSPSATTTGTTGNYTYQVFTYTTETAGAGTGQSLYTINVGSGGGVCDVLVVGGGGSGSETHGGGGGAGSVIFMTNVIMNGGYTIKVGKGGICQVSGHNGLGGKGNDSEIFKTDNIANKIVAEGGGGGGQLTNANGGSGGSGGGGDAYDVAAGVGGAATPYTPILDGITGIKYGNNGGNAFGNPGHGGGGGGAGGVGENVLAGNNSGDNEAERAHGGVGIKSATINSVNYDFKTLFGTAAGGVLEADGFVYFGGGGGGGRWKGASNNGEGGNGGLGGGGKGGWGGGISTPNNGKGYPGINGTGGGGGGGGDYAPVGGNGGSGIVIIRYLTASTSSSISLIQEPNLNIITNYVGSSSSSGSSQWTTVAGTGSKIYYNAGNVGVGTIDPIAPLHIYNTSNARLLLDTSTTGTATLEFRRGVGADAQNDYRFINDTNSTLKLQYENSSQSFGNTVADLAWFSSNDTIIHKNTTFNGRVGIGTAYNTTVPTRTLDIVGDANITGVLSAGSFSATSATITNSITSNTSLNITTSNQSAALELTASSSIPIIEPVAKGVKQFPETPSTNANSWTDNGFSVVCKSSDPILDTQSDIFHLFNNLINTSNLYHSTQIFNASSPFNYTGSSSFKGANGLVLYIDLGRSITLRNMRMAPRDNAPWPGYNFLVAAPGIFKIYASNDSAAWTSTTHASWTEIHSQTTSLTFGYNQFTSFGNFSSINTPYRYFAMVVYNLTGNYGYLTFSEWDIFGTYDMSPVVINSDYKYLSFTHSGGTETQTSYTVNFPESTICDILVVGGGGGGGYSYSAGGGGGGGYVYLQNISVSSGNYTINVGSGGTAGVNGASPAGWGGNGANSSITGAINYIALGGGGGAGGSAFNYPTPITGIGSNGGSGGGGTFPATTGFPAGGTSTQLSTYGYGNGGNGNPYTSQIGGGGGGASGIVKGSGTGNDGLSNSITGSSITYSGGGGGGNDFATIYQGGSGGGGAGSNGSGTNVPPVAGTNGLGGGGGGARGGGAGNAAKGGSGIVIIRYKSTKTGNQTYKLGNYSGEFKVISSVSNTDTDYIRITAAGAITNPTGTASWNIGSDRRIKENIERASYDKCYENINKLELNRFNYVSGFNTVNPDKMQLGFIAQEVSAIFPKSISTQEYYTNTLSIPNLMSIDISQINYSLYGAVKKLIDINNEKETRIITLKNRIKKLKNLLNNTYEDTTSNIAVDTIILNDTTSNIAVDTIVIEETTSNILADTIVIDTISSNITTDTIVIEETTSNIAVDTIVMDTTTSNITADTIILDASSSNIPTDTIILNEISSNIPTDTIILNETTSNITADTIILDATSSNITADTIILNETSSNITADTIILDASSSNIPADTIILDASSSNIPTNQ